MGVEGISISMGGSSASTEDLRCQAPAGGAGCAACMYFGL
jgi:hypothetical protein